MYRALIIAFKDVKSILKINKRLPLIAAFVMLVTFLMAKGMGGFFAQGIYIERFDVVVVNQDNHPLSRVLVQQFTTDKNLISLINITTLENEQQAEQVVRQNKAVAAVVIPKGFVVSVEEGENYPIKLITNSAHPLKSEMIRSLMDSYVRSVSAGQSAINAVWDYYKQTDMTSNQRRQKIDRVITEITLKALARNSLVKSTTIKGINSVSPVSYYLASVIIVILMFITLSLSRAIVDEFNNRVVDRINLSNISRSSYLTGKFLGILLSGIVLIFLLFIAGSLIFTRTIQSGINYNLFILICTHFAVCGITVLFAVLVKSSMVMEMGGNIVIFIMAIVGGGVIPHIYLPDAIAKMAPFTINYWALKGFTQFTSGDLGGGYYSAAVLIISGTASLLLSILVFNRKRGMMA